MTQRVRTTMRPDLEIEVTDRERVDLERQGLLVPAEPVKPAPAPTKEK